MATTETECCGGNCAHSELMEFEPLPDVSEKSMAALLDGTGGVQLQRATQRLVQSLDDPNGVISAFSSFANG